MRCTYCGAHPADGSWFCPACFRNLPGSGRRRKRRGGLRPLGAAVCVVLALGLGTVAKDWLSAGPHGVAREAGLGGIAVPAREWREASPAAMGERVRPSFRGAGEHSATGAGSRP